MHTARLLSIRGVPSCGVVLASAILGVLSSAPLEGDGTTLLRMVPPAKDGTPAKDGIPTKDGTSSAKDSTLPVPWTDRQV